MAERLQILVGDCREKLKELPDESVNCVVTSPPYLGLRRYDGGKSEIGQEPTIGDFVTTLTEVFSEVRRVLRSDGVAWLNIGDGFAGSGRGEGCDESGKMGEIQKGNKGSHGLFADKPVGRSMKEEHTKFRTSVQASNKGSHEVPASYAGTASGLVRKNLFLIPERIAIALQDDGWIVRQRVIWQKANPMPESCRDRDSNCIEHIWMLTKCPRYWYDAEAVKQPLSASSVRRMEAAVRYLECGGGEGKKAKYAGMDASGGAITCTKDREELMAKQLAKALEPSQRKMLDVPGQTTQSIHKRRQLGLPDFKSEEVKYGEESPRPDSRRINEMMDNGELRFDAVNRKNVWRMSTAQSDDNHYAAFPEKLPLNCILSSCPPGGVVLDPFGGSGTTAVAALKTGRKAILIELNPEYVEIAKRRCSAIPDTLI